MHYEPSNDGLIYVCDRGADRIQVFRPDGTFGKEVKWPLLHWQELPGTFLSHDENQEFIYVADGANFKVHILNRESLEVLAEFGDGGRQPGLFWHAQHSHRY